jgi:hypothetical protein
MYFEHFQRSMAGKDPFSDCRIPILHALMGGFLRENEEMKE